MIMARISQSQGECMAKKNSTVIVPQKLHVYTKTLVLFHI